MLIGIYLFILLIFILLSVQLFSNAIEYLSQQIGISSGMAGSIFASIATALPETIVPILAIIAGTSNRVTNEEISIGAIVGSPLMLSTLSTFVMAISAIKHRSIFGRISPEKTGFVRDLNFFLIAFSLATVVMYIPSKMVFFRISISFLLISLYFVYVSFTLSASKELVEQGHHVIPSKPLIVTRIGFKNNHLTIIGQLVLGLALLVFTAKSFIQAIQAASEKFGISALLLSILIIPLATELPEKVNSVIWVRNNQDTLGFCNITGALVFQSTWLPALGIVMTSWQPSSQILIGIIITFIATVWLRLNASVKGLSILALFLNGMLYLIYLLYTLSS